MGKREPTTRDRQGLGARRRRESLRQTYRRLIMLLRRRRRAVDDRDTDRDVIVEHGRSFAKGPNLIVGSILLAYGLTGLLTNSFFPHASSSFPHGDPTGESWLGLEVNGWTNFFTITAGGLLLFGAAQHHLAKIMSLIVGCALGACAIIALIDGDVLGLAAANGWTELGWGIAAVVLLLNVFSPRARRERPVGTTAAAGDRTTRFGRRPAGVAEPAERTPATTARTSQDGS
jgi:hypothetical protein